jgi:hypothetical protein
MEAFDGAKSVLYARREKQRDTGIGNFCNEADGFIWPTEGLFFTPAGLRYDLLEVI